MQNEVTTYVNKFLANTGFYTLTATLYILNDMQNYNIVIIMFNLIFQIVISIFILISILLIYSLLMIGVESRTLESGIMRMVGVSKRGLLLMILLQSVMFVIPAIVFGLGLSIPALYFCYKFAF